MVSDGKEKTFRMDMAAACIVLILIPVMLYSGLRFLEDGVLFPKQTPAPVEKKTVTVNGVDHYPRQDITVMLVLGIDRMGEMEPSGSSRNEGKADMVMLLVLDETEKKCNIITLERNTMLDISVPGAQGGESGTVYGQLALAYTYGTGMEDSCETVSRTVSRFLLGAHIDHYVSMNMEAVIILNDAVGGVTVEVTDDFSGVDPTIGMGTVTLRGQQAIHFVRMGNDAADQSCVSRTERQEAYLDGFFKALKKTHWEAPETLTQAYSMASPYAVTDCSMTAVTKLMNCLAEYELDGIYSLQGEYGAEGAYYVADGERRALALKLFFAEK